MNKSIIVITLTALVLGACSTAPKHTLSSVSDGKTMSQKPIAGSGGYLTGDGPGLNPPDNIDAIPDAVPVAEALHPYANRPYEALENKYTPMTTVGNFKQYGIASWYGKKFHGVRTANGDKYDMYKMTAAHPTLPIPSYARVTNVVTKKSVIVRINDRGPFLHDRIIDLSYTAAHKLGIIGTGSSEVEVESIAPDKKNRPVTMAHEEPESDTSNHVFLQLGAFNTHEAAENFMSKLQGKLSADDKKLILFNEKKVTRVYFGPYASMADARSNQDQVRDTLGFMPIVSQR
jgi:rare lipoprotein A